MRISVDFPHPEGPITLMNSRFRTSNVIRDSAVIGPLVPSKVRVSASTLKTTGRAASSAMRV